MKVFTTVFLCACLVLASEAIIGGEDAKAAQFPFVVAIQAVSATTRHFCGGTLLSTQWILTAAQCLDGANQFTVLMGSNNLEGSDVNRVQAATSLQFIHPDYDWRTLEHDIGLLKLHLPIVFTSYIQPASLPTTGLVDDMTTIAVGWGAINDDLPGPVNHLKYVTVTTISNVECKLTYGPQVADSMVCVSGNYNEGTCTDDSGSPLLIQLNHHVWVVGVSSFSSQNGCETTDPSGYSRTWDDIDWIKNVTELA